MVEFLSVSLHGRNGAKKSGGGGGGGGGARASSSSKPDLVSAAAAGGSNLSGNGSPSLVAATAAARSLSRNRYGGGAARSLSRPRKTWHDDLKAIEASRRAKCGQLVDMIRLNIASYSGLLDDSSVETTKAHRLVLGVAQVHDLMSTNSLLDPASQHHQPSTLPPSDNNNDDFLLSLQQSEEVVLENFKSSADQLQTVDGKLLKSLAEIQDSKADLETRGSAILAGMVALEEQTVQAWDAYSEVVQASRRKAPGRFSEYFTSSSHGSGSAPAADGTGSGSGDAGGGGEADATITNDNNGNDDGSKPNNTGSGPGGKVDPWLAELQYRQALQSQKASMDASLKELEELFGQVSNYECRRRINLREYMILTCTSTKWVFTGAEAAQAVAVRDWIEKDTSAATIQEQVSAAVKARVEAMLAEQDEAGGPDENEDENPVDEDGKDDDAGDEVEVAVDDESGEVGQPPEGSDSDPVSVAMFYASLFPATSPLESDFLAAACVVERVFPNPSKGGDASKRPTYVALAVVTIDQMLHLFDLKEGSDIALDDAPERALDAVLKETGSFTSSSANSNTTTVSARDFGLDPSRTVDLTQMEATLGTEDNLVDLKLAPGATQSYPPLSLRTYSAREQVELINAIHGDSIKAMF